MRVTPREGYRSTADGSNQQEISIAQTPLSNSEWMSLTFVASTTCVADNRLYHEAEFTKYLFLLCSSSHAKAITSKAQRSKWISNIILWLQWKLWHELNYDPCLQASGWNIDIGVIYDLFKHQCATIRAFSAIYITRVEWSRTQSFELIYIVYSIVTNDVGWNKMSSFAQMNKWTFKQKCVDPHQFSIKSEMNMSK